MKATSSTFNTGVLVFIERRLLLDPGHIQWEHAFWCIEFRAPELLREFYSQSKNEQLTPEKLPTDISQKGEDHFTSSKHHCPFCSWRSTEVLVYLLFFLQSWFSGRWLDIWKVTILLEIPSPKLTWQWKIHHEWRCISCWFFFSACHVSFQGWKNTHSSLKQWEEGKVSSNLMIWILLVWEFL